MNELRLVAASDNHRGDLFTRLMSDLFFALGYGDLKFDVPSPGREVDVQGSHRLEPRRLAAECKAHTAKMGGAELNKFFGVLARERSKHSPLDVAGYFVSLGGFTETAIEQEKATDESRLVLLSGRQVVEQLEKSRVVASRLHATERSGHCAQIAGLTDVSLDGLELLGTDRGYVWCVYYARGKERCHFALVHADGTPLAKAVAEELVRLDQKTDGTLHQLTYLPPSTSASELASAEESALGQYRQWLSQECGYIQLDGMPADSDLQATRLKLEQLFVPVEAILKSDESLELKRTARHEPPRQPIGKLLEKSPHLALLAIPGGGKSTLIKRLAIAYAFPDRRKEIHDELPTRDWLPLILRCRELRERVNRPIIEILNEAALHAGMTGREAGAFYGLIHKKIRAGEALILIDGLDEISEERDRLMFATHLRTFIAMFPSTAVVVTSREAGFRQVAGVVASACTQARLAPLQRNDVINLCEKWHVEVVGDKPKVRTDAIALGRSIWADLKIRTLAENPLLLTTLLVVRRNLSELPKSRTALYREAIKVLVRTWNIEGYEPLDEEETLAQLSYVASAMMTEGKQQLGRDQLLTLLQCAREELDSELQFLTISPDKFIQRIEYRSSLLMQVGHETIDDKLQPVYEFRHLTFQEYLAARAYVEQQYPGRGANESLANALSLHFSEHKWREVIPLAVVLAGRKAEDLFRKLIEACSLVDRNIAQAGTSPIAHLLLQCVHDEPQIAPATLRLALNEIASRRCGTGDVYERGIVEITRGKFGSLFQEVAEQSYLDSNGEGEPFLECLSIIAVSRFLGATESLELTESTVERLRIALVNGSRMEKFYAALVCMRLAYSESELTPEKRSSTAGMIAERDRRVLFRPLIQPLFDMVTRHDVPIAVGSSWAIAWIADNRHLVALQTAEPLLRLWSVWFHLGFWIRDARLLAWAISCLPLMSRDAIDQADWGPCDDFLRGCLAVTPSITAKWPGFWTTTQNAALVIAWYRRGPWTDEELVPLVSKAFQTEVRQSHARTLTEILLRLGDAGRLEWNSILERERFKAEPKS